MTRLFQSLTGYSLKERLNILSGQQLRKIEIFSLTKLINVSVYCQNRRFKPSRTNVEFTRAVFKSFLDQLTKLAFC
jgi:hypothetical protein